MSIELERLYKNTANLYEMKILAGKNGLTNMVQWVHIIEDEEVTQCLHGHELVFTTGIRRKGSNWILNFTKLLCNIRASGLILSMGPYIKDIPQEVLSYCDEVAFPLITTPWKTKLVDVTRIYCSKIMQSEQNETSISNAFKEAIFNPDAMDYHKAILERHGFDLDGSFTVAFIQVETNYNDNFSKYYDIVKFHAEKIIKHRCEKYGLYYLDSKIILIFSEVEEDKIKTIMDELLEMCSETSGYHLHIAVGYNRKGIDYISDNYHVTLKILQLAVQQNEAILYYDKLGIYKLLISNDNQQDMKAFYNDYLGHLEDYDKSNGTEYLAFLQKYIESGYSVQVMAQSEYVHRNTIHYQLNKIKSILGCDLNNWQIRSELVMSFYVKNILKERFL